MQQRPRWWAELAILTAGYATYHAVRNARGANSVADLDIAGRNAVGVIQVEKSLHLYGERAIQQFFLHWPDLVRMFNVVYTTAHILVTAAVLVWLFVAAPGRYRRLRTALLISTGLALLGFAVFPVLPPRLLPAGYGFVDTLQSLGGLWSFSTPAIEKIADPYAAMPSLHLAWATWCALAVYPATRRRSVRAAALAYPMIVAVVVIATGNHYVLDCIGGAAIGVLGWAVSVQSEATTQGALYEPRHRRAVVDVGAEPLPGPAHALD
jgi:membrane-associated phospholipid phosphatase